MTNESERIVYDVVGSGDIEQIRAALSSHGHLIDRRNPDEDDRTPLHNAALRGHSAVIEELIRAGSTSIDSATRSSLTPMHLAAMNGHATAIATLVRLGSQAIDTPNSDGRTPLHLAVQSNRLPVVDAILAHSTKSIDATDNAHRTPLRIAVDKSSIELVERLVQAGGHRAIDTPDHRGITPMHCAVDLFPASAAKIIEALVRAGCRSIDAPCNRGMTPMHAAAHRGSRAAIECLVKFGSKAIETQTKQGLVPLYFALRGRMECLGATKTLKALGASSDINTLNLPEASLRYLRIELDEEEVFPVRQRVYFFRSLVDQLLVALTQMATPEPAPPPLSQKKTREHCRIV